MDRVDGSALIFDMMDALPDSIVWVKPVFKKADGAKEKAEFKMFYANASAHEFVLALNKAGNQQQTIEAYVENRIADPAVFEQYWQVYNEDMPQEINYFNPIMNKHFHIVRKKFNGGVLAISRDRTQDEHAEREQNIRTEFVQSMLNASLHGVILLRPLYNNHENIYDFIVLAANDAGARQLLFEPGVIVNKTMSSIVDNYKEAGFFDAYVNALQTNVAQRRELYYEDSRLKGWYDLGVAPINGSVVVTFENITGTKHAKTLVENAAAYLQTVIDIAQTGIFVFTPVYNDAGEVIDFRFRIANRTLAAYVSQQPSAVEGALGSQWFPAYHTNGLFHNYRDTYLTGKTNRFDFHYNADNIDVWLDIMSTKFGDEVLVTFSDYTPLKQLQEQLEASVKELKRSNDRLTEFAYVASHDLQEPLRKITTFGNLLSQRSSDALGEDGQRLIERMQNAADRMKTLISDLLNYSQMNTMVINLQPVNLNEIVQGVIADLENTVQENNAVIEVASLPTINADKLQLRQLFQNLVSNAIKFRRSNVSPQIKIAANKVKGEEAEIIPPQFASKIFYEIIVDDNGIGFPQQYAEQIFQIFQRLNGRNDYPGTGIGLAIVQKVVENHEGYIYAKSVPGEGASFYVLLPA